MVHVPDARHEHGTARARHADAQRPRAGARSVRQGSDKLLLSVQDFAHILDHAAPRRCQDQPRFALEERGAVLAFQFLDAGAERLLRDVEPLGRFAEIHLLGGDQKISQTSQRHLLFLLLTVKSCEPLPFFSV